MVLLGCAPAQTGGHGRVDEDDPDDGLFRDFHTDDKRDENGHPINAMVLEAEDFCQAYGHSTGRSFVVNDEAGVPCEGTLNIADNGQIVNLRLRAYDIYRRSDHPVVRVTVGDADPVTWTGRSFRREGRWAFLPVRVDWRGEAHLRVETFGEGSVELDYIEVVPDLYTVALGPGSRVLEDDEKVSIEGALDHVPTLTVNGAPIDLEALVAAGQARRADTSFRRVYAVEVGQLAAGRPGDLDLLASGDGEYARMRVYRAAPPCHFEGDQHGRRVLLTGFQPFPANESHDNVSRVALQALDPAKLVGAQVMRLELPVEYDDAPALVTDAIERCAPEVVINMGQGSSMIQLEHTAYNLKDAGLNVDNRGRFQAGQPIIDDGPESLPSGLPLAALTAGLANSAARAALGVVVADSDDPGRYVCNNTFYRAVRAAAEAGGRAGFVHLPYTTTFTDESRAQWGEVARAIVEAAVSAY